MKQLSLEELLRYGFAGGIFLLSSWVLYPDLQGSLQAKNPFKEAVYIAALSLLLGSIFYSLHRSLIYPIFHRLVLIMFCCGKNYRFSKDLLIPYRPSSLEIEIDLKRWKLLSDEKSMLNRLSEWTAQTHFLYSSAWSLVISTLLDNLSSIETGDKHIELIVLSVSFLFLLAGITHHIRAMFFERIIMEHES